MSKILEYDQVLHEEDDGGAWVAFPWDIRQMFGRGRVRVRAEFDGAPYSGSIVNMGLKTAEGGVRYVIGVRRDIRARINKHDGDIIHVRIEAEE